jgi:hypothetical protein
MKLSIVGKVFFAVSGIAIILWMCGYNVFTKEMISDFGRCVGRQFMVHIVVLGSLTMYWTFHPVIALLLMPVAALVDVIGLAIFV